MKTIVVTILAFGLVAEIAEAKPQLFPAIDVPKSPLPTGLAINPRLDNPPPQIPFRQETLNFIYYIAKEGVSSIPEVVSDIYKITFPVEEGVLDIGNIASRIIEGLQMAYPKLRPFRSEVQKVLNSPATP